MIWSTTTMTRLSTFAVSSVLLLLFRTPVAMSVPVAGDIVRNLCNQILSTAFPPNEFGTVASLQEFATNYIPSDGRPTYFAAPQGNPDGTLVDFSADDFMQVVREGFHPELEWMSDTQETDILVTGNTCSVNIFFLTYVPETKCTIPVREIVVLELYDDGMMKSWINAWDSDTYNAGAALCNGEEPEESNSETVRLNCQKVFETAFPEQGWATRKTLKEFVDLVATDVPNYFACPQGGGEDATLTEYEPKDLYKWFITHFDPFAIKYTEIISSDIMVSGNVCAFDKIFFAEIGDCNIEVLTHLIMEVDDDGRLVSWMDFFDEEEVEEKLEKCLRRKNSKSDKKKKKNHGKKEHSSSSSVLLMMGTVDDQSVMGYGEPIWVASLVLVALGVVGLVHVVKKLAVRRDYRPIG